MDDQLSYDLDEWSGEARELLDRLLTSEAIAHVWQGGTLTVSPDDEEAVDALVDEVEMAVLPSLDPDAEKVLYEVAEWSVEARQDLTDALVEEGVRHDWDAMGDLVIQAIDEDRVDAILEDLDDGEDDEDEPLVATDVLSDLFVAADKLRRNPREPRAVESALARASEVIALSPPYGFERATWARIGLRAGALRTALADEEPDDDAVAEAATELRELLHPLV